MAKKKDDEVVKTQESPGKVVSEANETPQVPEVTEKLKTQKVAFIVNVKHNNTCYKKGESLEVPEADYEVLLKAGVLYVAT